jgi:hypothetical protein
LMKLRSLFFNNRYCNRGSDFKNSFSYGAVVAAF